jgi:ATP-dependent 26S proteasome regulatory subunit
LNPNGLLEQNAGAIEVTGVPRTLNESTAAVFRSRLDRIVRELIVDHKLSELNVNLRFGMPAKSDNEKAVKNGQVTERDRSQALPPKYVSRDPLFSKDFLVIATEVRERLESAVQIIELQHLLFDTWGLSQIEPSPRSALNFHGPPGTGKTLAAHAVADATGRQIICASYADIESMYHGEGPKNVAELFRAAEASNAVLFIDEADSLLSKRLTNVTQGSEQAINSMRSQLLICLDNFKGIVVFATNLISNYDPAFDTRVKHIHFPVPDRETRLLLWKKHLPEKLPVGELSLDSLADLSENLVGREIKMAVIDAAVAAARAKQSWVSQLDFIAAIESIKEARQQKDPQKPVQSSV